MAGDWIKIEHALPDKPEVMSIASDLGISEEAVVGHLVRFWSWVDQNMSRSCPAVSGTISGLNRVAGRDGFAEALINVGWLRFNMGKVEIPNYDDHLSQSAKSRSLESKKKKRQRSRCCPDNVPVSSGQKLDQRREEKSISSSSSKKNSAVFQKPTVDEVRAYCTDRKNSVDPEAFIAFYESKGWRIGNQPMKDWKAAVITWEKRNVGSENSRGVGPTGGTRFDREQQREQQQLGVIEAWAAKHAGGVREGDSPSLRDEADGGPY